MMKAVVLKLFFFLFIFSGLTACGGGGGSDPAPIVDTTPPPDLSTSISGGGVKGPLAKAVVTIYAFDASKAGFKGAVVATAATDANAAITGLALPFPVTPPYIMEFTSTPGTTTDITTGQFPVITTMRTVITKSLLDGGEQIYATPLTTMAVDIAIANGSTSTTAAQFETALTAAASQVVSTLGFGLDGSVDIFDTPPLVDNTTGTTAEQANVAAYRAAVEAVTAVAFQINQQSSGGDTDSVMAELAADLADDGEINKTAGSQINDSTLQVLQQDPATLPIPNSPTNQTVADVQAILVAEAATTAPAIPVTDLDAGGTITTTTTPAETNPDSDNDTVLNADDAFPDDATETIDTDGDGIGDNADPDDDNNGILDVDEGIVAAPTALDTDGDGVNDDAPDNCPADFNPAQTNTDALLTGSDALGDVCDADDDGDGVVDTADAFPLDDTETIDTDRDGLGDAVADSDDDNDGVLDGADTGTSPLDGTTACAVLIDCDGDGVFDGADFNPIDDTVTFNFAPVTVDDTAAVNEDAALFSIAVTTNDTDNDGNPNDIVTLTAVGTASLGSAVMNGNSIDYTPTADAFGTDTFTYTVSDGNVSSTGSVTVTITAINDNPVSTDDTATTLEDTAVTTADVTANDTDVDGDTVTATLLANAGNGNAVDNTDGTFTYTPNADFNGADSFTYTLSDGNGGSTTGTVDVTVTAVNDNPVANADTLIADEDVAATTVDVTANDIDVDALTTLSVVAGNPVATNGSVLNNNDGTFTYTPNADYFGNDSFTYNLSDGTTGTAVGTVNITVNPINDAPVAIDDAVTTDEDTEVVTGNVTLNDTDVDGDATSAVLLANASNGNVVKKGGSAGTFTYTPNPDYIGPDSFTYTVSDGNGGSATGTVNITVTAINDTPVAVDDSLITNEDTAGTTVDVTTNDTDVELDTLSVAAGNPAAANGTVVNNNDGTFTYTPNANFNGADSFTYGLSDGNGGSDSGTVNVTVIPVNDDPVGNADAFSAAIATLTSVNVLANDTDVDVDNLTITNVSAGDRASTITTDGSIVSFTDAAGAGTTTFTYDISDGNGGTVTGISVAMTITANIPPVANPDSATTDEDTAVTTANVLANDNNGGDGPGALSIDSADTTSANGGNVVNHGDGTFTYTPDADFSGSDTFTYTVSDTTSTSVGTVTIAVNPVNDSPVANVDVESTDEDTAVTTVDVRLNDTDTESDTLAATLLANASNGNVVDNVNGTFTYTPESNFNGGDSFTYALSDGNGGTVTGTVSITVNPVNDAPVANIDSVLTTIDTVVTTANVLTNDTDVENDTLTATLLANATNGNVVDNGNGTFNYTPTTGYTGSDSFTYTVSDSVDTDVGTVNITVNVAGTSIALTTLMSPTEGGVVGIDEVGPDEYEYWTDNWDSVSGLIAFEDIAYNHSTSLFETIAGGNELWLSGGTWVTEGNIYATDDGSGGLIASVRDSFDDGIELARIKLTARFVDLQGAPIANYLDAVWQGAMINANAVFNTGAKLITEYRFEQLSDSYNLWIADWCEFNNPAQFALLKGNCDAVNVDISVNTTGYAQLLDEVIAATAWIDNSDFTDPPGAVQVAWNGQTTLMVQFVGSGTSGTANYYVVNWNDPDPATRVSDAVAGTNWVRDTSSGVEMLQFLVPDAFVAQFPGDLDEGLNYFLTEQNGFVRRGHKGVVGDVGFDNDLFNGNAMSDVLGNFSAPALPPVQGPAELVGTWVSSNLSSNSDPLVIHFFANGYYESSGTCDFDVPPSTGMEYGTYTWDPATGSYTAGAQFTNQGACGPQAGMFNGNTIAVNGDVLTLSIPGFGDTLFNRLLGTANPLVGSWVYGDITIGGEGGLGGHAILTFLDDGTFTQSEDCTTDGAAGFEFGAYAWDQGITDLLSGSMLINTNGGCGLELGVITPPTTTVDGDTLTLDFGNGDIAVLTRKGGSAALTCGYESPWNNAASEPLVFNSFTDFEEVVIACGGANTTVEADIIGVWNDAFDDNGVAVIETWVFNANNTADYSETRDTVLTDSGTVSWSLSNNLVTLSISGVFLDVWAFTPVGVKVYTEEQTWSSNPDLLTLDGVAEGEIWSSSYIKQP